MKKHLTIVCSVWITLMSSIAQNNFIEVNVEDTVTLKPVKISYLIINSQNNSTEALDLYSDEKTEERKHIPIDFLAETEKILKMNDFTYTKITLDKFPDSDYQKIKNYDIYNYDYDIKKDTEEGIIVELNSLEGLDKLFNTLKNQKGIKGEIFDIILESKDKYRETLIKNLFTKAQKEAAFLANLSGLKLGKLISAGEASNNNYTILDWYKDILSFGKFNDMIRTSLYQTYSCKFTFKFEVN